MDPILFAKIIGPALCLAGINMTFNKSIINGCVEDILSSTVNHIVSSLTLSILGAMIIALFQKTQNGTLALALGFAFLISGMLRLIFTTKSIQLIQRIGVARYIRSLGCFSCLYGFGFIYQAFAL